MELEKIGSAGDPVVVRRNKQKIDPLFPSIIAVSVQLIATVYLHSINAPTKSVVASAILTAIYALVTYLLNKKPIKNNSV